MIFNSHLIVKNQGNKIIFCGNIGYIISYLYLMKLVAEFLNKRKSIPAISLKYNTSTITAIANDGLKKIFFQGKFKFRKSKILHLQHFYK